MKKLISIIILTLAGLLAQSQVHYEVTHISSCINTIGSETGAIVVDDSILLYTTMQGEESSRLYLIDFNPILTTIKQAPLNPDGTLGEGTSNQWGLNVNGTNCGNVAYDPRGGIIYFTRSNTKDPNIHHIYYTKRTHTRWSKPQPLGGNVNIKGYSSTHPAVGYLPDGKTILYFSSDRPGGLGGMDIWYTIIISEGKPGNCTNLGTPVNSDSNDVTPYYCNEEGTLYFSSNREGGQGSYDIYSSLGWRNSWELPHNLGPEVNSAYDDLFFTFQPCKCRCVNDTSDTTVSLGLWRRKAVRYSPPTAIVATTSFVGDDFAPSPLQSHLL